MDPFSLSLVIVWPFSWKAVKRRGRDRRLPRLKHTEAHFLGVSFFAA